MGKKKNSVALIPQEVIENKILLVRGKKVMLDRDLAKLYGVSPKRLNEQVKRNLKRFPEDFMFQLSKEEVEYLRSQIAALKQKRGEHRKYLPYAFTEQGLAMLSTVLNSERAIHVNIAISAWQGLVLLTTKMVRLVFLLEISGRDAALPDLLGSC